MTHHKAPVLDGNDTDNFFRIIKHGAAYAMFLQPDFLTAPKEEVLLDACQLIEPLFTLAKLPVPNLDDLSKHLVAEITAQHETLKSTPVAMPVANTGLVTQVAGENSQFLADNTHDIGIHQRVKGEPVSDNVFVGATIEKEI